jgi:hypothetical protein
MLRYVQYQTVALTVQGTVVCWGSKSVRELDVPVGLDNVISVSSCTRSLALTREGTHIGWGPKRDQCEIPQDFRLLPTVTLM